MKHDNLKTKVKMQLFVLFVFWVILLLQYLICCRVYTLGHLTFEDNLKRNKCLIGHDSNASKNLASNSLLVKCHDKTDLSS